MQKHKAYIGWPGLYFEKNNLVIKIHELEEYKGNKEGVETKAFRFLSNGLVVKTIDSQLVITYLQFPGKKIISSSDAFNAYKSFFV